MGVQMGEVPGISKTHRFNPLGPAEMTGIYGKPG